MSAHSLAAALAAHGFACEVEAHDALAVLIPGDGAGDVSDPALRELALRLGREHGFTHVAVELARPAAGA